MGKLDPFEAHLKTECFNQFYMKHHSELNWSTGLRSIPQMITGVLITSLIDGHPTYYIPGTFTPGKLTANLFQSLTMHWLQQERTLLMLQTCMKSEDYEKAEKNWRNNVGTFTGLASLMAHQYIETGHGALPKDSSNGAKVAAYVACNLLAYPFSTAYHRYMLDRTRDEPKYTSSLNCLASIASEEGVGNLYYGYGTYTWRSAFQHLVFFGSIMTSGGITNAMQ